MAAIDSSINVQEELARSGVRPSQGPPVFDDRVAAAHRVLTAGRQSTLAAHVAAPLAYIVHRMSSNDETRQMQA